MENFNIQRFGKLTKWFVINTKSMYIQFTAITAFILFIFCLLEFRHVYSPEFFRMKIDSTNDFMACFYISAMVFMPSFMFSGMKTHQTRINYFMLPGTNLEKFVSRYLSFIIGYTLCFIVAFFVADLLQWLFCFMIHPEQTHFFLFPFSEFKVDMNVQGVNYNSIGLFLVALTFWSHSMYLLGGTIFRRNHWIFTTMFLLVLSSLITWLLSFFDGFHNVMQLSQKGIDTFFYGGSAVLAILFFFNYWLSFRTFKHTQVICNKWINL
jgi:hypothetical protein